MTSQATFQHRRTYWTRMSAVMKEWSRAPTQVASIIPSFPFLTQQIADRDCVRSSDRIVDLGPGTGGTTEKLLHHAHPNCRVLAIEKTAGFIQPLKQIADRRLTVVQDDVVGLERILMMNHFRSPDVIVSGIPFSSLDRKVAESTMKAIHRVLPVGGTFIAYQLRGHIAKYASRHFARPDVAYVPVNLPPLRIYTWIKLSG